MYRLFINEVIQENQVLKRLDNVKKNEHVNKDVLSFEEYAVKIFPELKEGIAIATLRKFDKGRFKTINIELLTEIIQILDCDYNRLFNYTNTKKDEK